MRSAIRKLAVPVSKSRDLSVVALGVLLRTISALIFAKLTAFYLGPLGYSLYGHFYMLASYLTTASCLGLANAFSVYIGRSRNDAKATSANAPAVVAIGGIAGTIISLFLVL